MATKILAIDDSKTMRLAIKITFAAEDAEVTSVSKGSDAVARIKAKAGGYDVVLVDAQLASGEPSGYDVCRAIKNDPATAKIPVVILVSNQTGVDQAQLDAAGGDGSIAKPFETQALIDLVAEVQAAGARPAGAAAEPAAATPAPKPAPAKPVAPKPSATGPRPVVSAPPAAGRAARQSRPANRTQMGMPTPAMAAAMEAGPPAAAAPAPRRTPTGPTATVKPAAKPTPTPAPKPAPKLAKPVVSAPPAARPAAAARQTVADPGPAPRPAVAATPAAATPVAASSSDAAIPVAIPIPFTAADSPTAGMSARLAKAAGAAGVDPKVAEALAALSHEVLERIAWEVVPELAESIIREQAAKQSA